jgi:hypothetical protein
MAEQGLNDTEIDAGFEQVCSKGVPEQMRMNGLGNAGLTGSVPASHEDRLHRDGPGGIGAGKKPIRRPLASPIQSLPVFPPFAETNPQHIAGAVDVGDFEACHFTDSEARPIKNRQQGAMAQIARRLQQGLDFVAAQNQRQPPLDVDTFFSLVRNN